MKPFYITTTLPYVNSDPHVGFAMEIIRADIIARHKKLTGFEVFFNTGTDEHGEKIQRKALEQGISTQAYVDEYAAKFKNLIPLLGISEDVHFIRTTDQAHIKAAQEFWKRCDANGDIYKKAYKTKYCVGCELQKTESELVDDKCPIHPNLEIEIIDEENYFFKFSKYQDKLLDLYKNNPHFVLPESRLNEIRAFVERGLEDFSISRLKEKMSWGVPVPGDDKHVMYVWFDALTSYISTLGWSSDTENFNKYWSGNNPIVQYCGKDNLRQQAAMWQAMLMSAGLPNSTQIIVDGFITSGGQKMSKSLGNVIDPVKIVNEYGTDALRYFLAREISPFEDGDFTIEKFKESYNANLANGLGNLVSRVMKMAETNITEPVNIPENTLPVEFKDFLAAFEIQKATNLIWERIGKLDLTIQETQPFKLIKTDKEKALEIIKQLVVDLNMIGYMLSPIFPETSEKIIELIKQNKSPEKPLFARKD